eukprot:s710_g3.t1
MNQIYETNPQILEDFHRALVSGGKGGPVRQSAFLEDTAKGPWDGVTTESLFKRLHPVELRETMEKNLQQLNAMYEANPRILEDVHRAVQGGGTGEAFL